MDLGEQGHMIVLFQGNERYLGLNLREQEISL